MCFLLQNIIMHQMHCENISNNQFYDTGLKGTTEGTKIEKYVAWKPEFL